MQSSLNFSFVVIDSLVRGVGAEFGDGEKEAREGESVRRERERDYRTRKNVGVEQGVN